jgi:hypothetical protein
MLAPDYPLQQASKNHNFMKIQQNANFTMPCVRLGSPEVIQGMIGDNRHQDTFETENFSAVDEMNRKLSPEMIGNDKTPRCESE